MTTTSIIVGSTREGSFSEKVVQWTQAKLAGRECVQSKLLNLRDLDLLCQLWRRRWRMCGRTASADRG